MRKRNPRIELLGVLYNCGSLIANFNFLDRKYSIEKEKVVAAVVNPNKKGVLLRFDVG